MNTEIPENMFPPNSEEMDNEETGDLEDNPNEEEGNEPSLYPQEVTDWGNNYTNEQQEFQDFQYFPEQNPAWGNDYQNQEYQQYQQYQPFLGEGNDFMYQPQQYQPYPGYPQQPTYWPQEFVGEAEEQVATPLPGPAICQCKIKKGKKPSKVAFQSKLRPTHGLGPLLDEMIQAVLTYQPEDDDICQFLALYVKAKIDQKTRQSVAENLLLTKSRILGSERSLTDIRHLKFSMDEDVPLPELGDVYKKLSSEEEDPRESVTYSKKRSTDPDGGEGLEMFLKQKRGSNDDDADKSLEEIIFSPKRHSGEEDEDKKSLEELEPKEERLSGAELDAKKSGEDLRNEEEQPSNEDEEGTTEAGEEDTPNPRESLDENGDKGEEDPQNQKRLSADVGAEGETSLDESENQKRLSEGGEDAAEKKESDPEIRKLSNQSKSED